MDFRGKAQKALEEARNEKVIGKSLEAHLTIYPDAEVKELLESLNTNLAQLLIVSALTIAEGDVPESAVRFQGVSFTVERAEGCLLYTSELDTVLNQIKNLDKICIVGLMTMAPIDANTQELDKIFAETNELRQSIQDKKLKNVPCDQLSMGMSRDYDIAIQNGSTFVRIGSAFFKENGE